LKLLGTWGSNILTFWNQGFQLNSSLNPNLI
jgi:hypothetical protein